MEKSKQKLHVTDRASAVKREILKDFQNPFTCLLNTTRGRQPSRKKKSPSTIDHKSLRSPSLILIVIVISIYKHFFSIVHLRVR